MLEPPLFVAQIRTAELCSGYCLMCFVQRKKQKEPGIPPKKMKVWKGYNSFPLPWSPN